jgi:putative ATPase
MMEEPLAQKLRPKKLDEVVGQSHLLGPDGLLSRTIGKKKPLSLLLWGPPGCGKTTILQLYAKHFEGEIISFSAVSQKMVDLKKLIAEREQMPLFQKQIILIVDEIHRLNTAQQDTFLPFLERGSVILLGATTENPSFSINSALLSRLRVLTLEPLGEKELDEILVRFEKEYGTLALTKEARSQLIRISGGDGRYLLNMVENLLQGEEKNVDDKTLSKIVQKRAPKHDKQGEGHYNLISALHKSVRGSDPDASLFWLCRLLEAGESRQFIARRMIRMASEDIGLADPQALSVVIHCYRAYEQLGTPEGELALAQAIVYLALAPKSNSIYTAYRKAKEAAEQNGHLSPPKCILNAPTSLMKEFGYGEGYRYDHDEPQRFSGQNYFPDSMPRTQFYDPVDIGFEREMKKRYDYFSNLRKQRLGVSDE